MPGSFVTEFPAAEYRAPVAPLAGSAKSAKALGMLNAGLHTPVLPTMEPAFVLSQVW